MFVLKSYLFNYLKTVKLNTMKTLKILSIISLITFIQSCSKDTKCSFADTNIYYNLADSNKAKIPYTGTDTLVFISDQGDTATLVGQGKKTYYNTITNNAGTVDCPKIENRNYENVNFEFKNDTSIFFKATFSILKYDVLGGYPSTTSIKFNFNNTEIDFSNIEYIMSFKSFQDSILLNGKYVGGVYLGFNTYNALFNFENGILKFKYNNKNWILSN